MGTRQVGVFATVLARAQWRWGGTDLIKVLLEGHESEEDAGRKAANEF